MSPTAQQRAERAPPHNNALILIPCVTERGETATRGVDQPADPPFSRWGESLWSPGFSLKVHKRGGVGILRIGGLFGNVRVEILCFRIFAPRPPRKNELVLIQSFVWFLWAET